MSDFVEREGSETGETGIGGLTTGGGAGPDAPPPQGEPPATDDGSSDYGFESAPPGPETDPPRDDAA